MVPPPSVERPSISNPKANNATSRISTKTFIDGSFEDQFFRSNEMQMYHDINSIISNEVPNEDPYVTFGDNRGAGFEDLSMLENPTPPSLLGTTERKQSFFYNFCYKLLKTGQCSYDDKCRFSHMVMIVSRSCYLTLFNRKFVKNACILLNL